MRRTSALLLALLLGLVAASARAQTAIAVLGIEPQDAPEALARDLTQALRQRAASAANFSPVAGKDLVEIKLVFGCVDEAPACMAHAGRSLGAAKLLFGSLRRAPGGLKVSLKWLDVPSARLENALTELVAPDLATTTGLRGLAVRWFATLSGVGASGSLLVNAPPGTRVFVDDQIAGTAGDHPLSVAQVPPGIHEIRAEKWGFRSYSERVRVASGEVTQINAHLEAEVKEREKEPEPPSSATLIPPPGPEPGRDNGERPGHGMRIAFWSSVGAAALMTVSAIVAGTQVLSLEDDKAAALATTQSQAIRMNCTAAAPCPDVCKYAGGSMGDPKIASICDSANRDATLTNVFIGVGAASLVAASFFYYRGYLEPHDSNGKASAPGGTTSRLRLAPQVGQGSAGVVAEFEF